MLRILACLILSTLLWSTSVFAQINASSPNRVITSTSTDQVSPEPSPNTPEWQLTLDVIRAKSDTLVDKNNKLVAHRDAMAARYTQLETSITELKANNDELRQFLKDRHGRSDEQIHLEEIASQVKFKEAQVKEIQKELTNLQDDVSSVQQKIQLKKLKMTALNLQNKEDISKANIQKAMEDRNLIENSEELTKLREAFEQERKNEDVLGKQLAQLKPNQPKEGVLAPVDDAQIELLEKNLQTLRQQKEDLQKRISVDNNQPGQKRYEKLMLKKRVLEETIHESEVQLNRLRDPHALSFLSNPRKKEVLRQMIEVDTRNGKLRQKMVSLREDLDLLREQVRRLERKLKASNKT